ncbi:hypothetical protein B6U98_03290 [Thermoplasmatales archaeon ex4572_165]|nr:MAG: hypothetical protein B6U98_03290 [Thermoplasmatales archaeon ex4572_165]
MTFDYIVEGKIFLNNSFQQCCIGIEDEKITSVKKILTGAKKKKFPKQVVLPAGIDIHVHFRDPGFPQKETFQTGSIAAAFGGIACVFDMPNTKPQTTNKVQILSKIEHANQKSVIDFGIYACISDENIAIIDSFFSLVPGFKIFLGSTTNSQIFSQKNLSALFKNLKNSSKPVLFHAEDSQCLIENKREESHIIDHNNARPCTCEAKAVQSILQHSPFPCPVHICHVSSIDALNLLLMKKDFVSFGSTPHHCLLNIDYKTKLHQSYFKVNPPLRPINHQTVLFNALKEGKIPILESDHAPHTLMEKSGNFSDSPSGISGVETMYPLFLFLAYQQIISFSEVISAVCERPAKLLNLSKGLIKEGYDADFVVVDVKKQMKISPEILHSKATHSPFEGFNALFPQHVYVRGHPVVEENVLIAKPGNGEHVINNESES